MKNTNGDIHWNKIRTLRHYKENIIKRNLNLFHNHNIHCCHNHDDADDYDTAYFKLPRGFVFNL